MALMHIGTIKMITTILTISLNYRQFCFRLFHLMKLHLDVWMSWWFNSFILTCFFMMRCWKWHFDGLYLLGLEWLGRILMDFEGLRWNLVGFEDLGDFKGYLGIFEIIRSYWGGYLRLLEDIERYLRILRDIWGYLINLSFIRVY